MENIVTKIIEIDQQADEKLAASQAEMREILAAAKAKAAKCREELQAAADRRIAEVTAFHQSEYDRQCAALQSAATRAASALDQTYAAQHAVLEDELFHAVLGT